MSVFLERNHLFLRAPDGGVEDLFNMADHGFTAVFCNVRDYPPERWQFVREQAVRYGVACGPWGRTTTPDNEFDPDLVLFIIETAEAWGGTPYIINAESDLKGSGAELTSWLQRMCNGDDWALSMEPWPFANVDWTPIKVPVLPQCFGPDWGRDAAAVRTEWQRVGVNCVVLTFGTYSGWGPELYPLKAPYGLYTADDCGNNFERWEKTGTASPCKTGPAPPTNGGATGNDIPPVSPDDLIGSEHGITAFVDWLQKQPNMPTRSSSYDPRKPGTWPWPERLERTLKILAASHDEAL